MAYIRNNPIPRETIAQLNLNNFIGGLNNVTSAYELHQYESPDMLNAWIYNEGVLEPRTGTILYDDVTLNDVVNTTINYGTPSDSFLILCCDEHTYLYKKGVVTEILHMDEPIPHVTSGFQYENSVFFINGERYYEFDGEDVYRIVQPVTPNEEEEIEGDVVGLSYDEETMTVRYRPIDFEITDPYYGSNNITDFEKCKDIVLRPNKQVVYGACASEYQNIVFYTDFDNPYYVPANQWIPPISHDGQSVTGLTCFNDTVVIFKPSTIFALYGSTSKIDDEDTYNLKEVTVHTGTRFPRTIQKVGNSLYFLGSDGRFYTLYDVRTDYQKMLTVCVSEQIDINLHPISLEHSTINKAWAVHYENLYICFINDKILTHRPKQSWSLFDNLEPNTTAIVDNVLLLFKEFDGTTSIHRWAFKPFYMTEQFVIKDYGEVLQLKYGYINEIREAKMVINGRRDYDVVNGTSVDDITFNYKDYVAIIPLNRRYKIKSDGNIQNNLIKVRGVKPGDIVTIEYLSMVSYNDYKTPYTAYWQSKDFDFGYPSRQKQIRNLFVLADTYKWFDSIINLTAYVDYTDVNASEKLANKIALWGVSTFGDKFINRNIIKPQRFTINRRGNIISFKIHSSDMNNPFRVFSLSADINVRPK